MMKLKKIYSKHIPFKGNKAITILFWMIVRKEYMLTLSWWVDVHENTHLAQEIELAIVLFYILYVLEFAIKLLITFNWDRAYRSVSFEQEAYNNQFNKDYLENRRHYAWIKYVFTLKPREL